MGKEKTGHKGQYGNRKGYSQRGELRWIRIEKGGQNITGEENIKYQITQRRAGMIIYYPRLRGYKSDKHQTEKKKLYNK